MNRVRVVGEDALCCALGERLIGDVLPDWTLGGESINVGGRTKLVSSLRRYLQQARHVQPIVCIADTDHQCPVELLHRWMPPHAAHDQFVLRLAVSEAESWVLADREGSADFFGVALRHIPRNPELEPDAKRVVLGIARRSKKRLIRVEMISPADPSKPGNGYNHHLRRLVSENWQSTRASANSTSLRRAIERILALRQPALP